MVSIIVGIVMLILGIVFIVYSILILMGNLKIIIGFDLTNIPEEKKRKFCVLMSLHYLFITASSLTGGILLLIFRSELMLFISIGICLGGILLITPTFLLIIKKFNGKIVTN